MTANGIRPCAFEPLALAEIRPAGWLARQLRLQADGLSGHLDEFWPDVRDSGWIGGQAEGWERMPYWLDGVIPLAWLLDHGALQARIHRYLDCILAGQRDDGWLGPRIAENAAAGDLWSQILALKMLVSYHDACGDVRIADVVERALTSLDRHTDVFPLSGWAQLRWFDALVPIYFLYAQSGERWLLDLAVKLRAQGFDWRAYFARWPQTAPTPRGRWNLAGHVVNNAMALRAPALWWRSTGDEGDRAAAYRMIEALDECHGLVTGVFSGDECLAGTSPVSGTELCAVVESMHSLELLVSVLGDPSLADRLERIAFNALPAAFSPDMWAHQYDQQVNQIECSVRDNRTWTTNGPDANIFGLEPNFGCCTANLSQGWPRLARHLWMRTGDGGLVAVAYAPSRVNTRLGDAAVRVELDTGYPFRADLRFAVTVDRPVRFPLVLRVPGWAGGARVRIGGDTEEARAGTFHRIERTWTGTALVELDLPMPIGLARRPRSAVVVERGPLVYSLRIGEQWRRIHADVPGRELPHADWEVYPTTPWNYALVRAGDGSLVGAEVEERPVGERPFSPDGTPVVLRARGCRVPGWVESNGSAGEVPPSPVVSGSDEEALELIPYGCTNLRITEFPWV